MLPVYKVFIICTFLVLSLGCMGFIRARTEYSIPKRMTWTTASTQLDKSSEEKQACQGYQAKKWCILSQPEAIQQKKHIVSRFLRRLTQISSRTSIHTHRFRHKVKTCALEYIWDNFGMPHQSDIWSASRWTTAAAVYWFQGDGGPS